MSLTILSQHWYLIQDSLFPNLEEKLGKLTVKQKQLTQIIEIARIEELLRTKYGYRGRPPKDRVCIAHAFLAKAVYNIASTTALIERLCVDSNLRRICGWEKSSNVPSESTFSRAFTEFSQSRLLEHIHEELIKNHLSSQLLCHLSRDSTEIVVRERAKAKELSKSSPVENKVKRKRGRPKKGEERVKEPTRLERQEHMSLEEMLEDLPKSCGIGTKKNSKGYNQNWVGYKFHIDTVDNQIPVSCILTSASVHDSQVALPLAEMSRRRVTTLYDLMDAAYDTPIIKAHSRSIGHVPIIDINPRKNQALKEERKMESQCRRHLNIEYPEENRYKERTAVERVNGRLKDEFGGRLVRVRGNAKVMTHLMFGILALTADQLLRLVT